MASNGPGAVPEVLGGVDSGREAVHPSPTDYNPSRMPRTVSSSTFVRAVSEAHALRVWIGKLIKISERNIVELSVLEAEKVEEDSEDEEYD